MMAILIISRFQSFRLAVYFFFNSIMSLFLPKTCAAPRWVDCCSTALWWSRAAALRLTSWAPLYLAHHFRLTQQAADAYAGETFRMMVF